MKLAYQLKPVVSRRLSRAMILLLLLAASAAAQQPADTREQPLPVEIGRAHV